MKRMRVYRSFLCVLIAAVSLSLCFYCSSGAMRESAPQNKTGMLQANESEYASSLDSSKLSEKRDGAKAKTKKEGNKTIDESSTGMIDADAIAADDKESKESGKGGADKSSSHSTISSKRAEGVSGLKAGFADDNRQFNYFIDFLNKFRGSARHIPVNVSERIVLKLMDAGAKSLPNASVKIFDGKKLLFEGKSYSDGSFPFFPSELGGSPSTYKAVVNFGKDSKTIEVRRYGKREMGITLPIQRTAMARVPLDILFVFDTTGSMGEEIARLKRTIELIFLNLSALPSRPLIRFGMVLYKDRGDEYITRVIPLTESLNQFQNELNNIMASGGGDLPEDLQSALHDAMNEIRWNAQGIRLCFVITDAPPHLDYGQDYTYYRAMRDARNLGVKIFTVGSGGLDINGEYVMRQISQYTSGKYIFLTYGEKGEAEGGAEGSVSHHTGANFQTDKLETIIMRFARDEIYNLSKEKEREDEEYFTAKKIDTEKSEETLQRLFGMATSQLVDYSTLSFKEKTPTSVLPINASNPALKLNAEYFTEQLIFSMSKNKSFALVERKNLQGIMKELELSMTGIVNEENAAKVGKLLGAKIIVTGNLYRKEGDYELFIKLLRVETAEVLSVTKARINTSLGIAK